MKQRGRRFLTGIFGVTLGAILLFGSTATFATPAELATESVTHGKPLPPLQAIGQWQGVMKKMSTPKAGCFTSSYPSTEWKELACNAEQKILGSQENVASSATSAPYFGDYMAKVSSGTISTAEGSFPEVNGLSSVISSLWWIADVYSLQLNTNFFSAPACNYRPGVPSFCSGWVQFVYQNYYSSGSVSIWYWLVSISACPAGWTRLGTDCYFTTSLEIPLQDIAELANMRLTGQVEKGGLDTATFTTTNAIYKVSAPDSTINLAEIGWTSAAFNIYGIGNYANAIFNNGAAITVKTTVDNGTTDVPACVQGVSTGEGNNLSKGPCCAYGGSAPSIMFAEASSADPSVTVCPSTGSITVTPVAGENGTISPSTAITKAVGASAQFTINPNPGYSIASVTGCDGSLDGNLYTTAALDADCNVTAAFVDTSTANVNLNQFGLSGAWSNPATSGQGFVLSMLPDITGPGRGLVVGGWFTYSADPVDAVISSDKQERQRWYTLQGPIDSMSRVAKLNIYFGQNGNFNAPPKIPAYPIGRATLQFSDCTSGTLTYSFSDGSGRQGTIPLKRVDANITCSPAGDSGTSAPSYLLSGPWYQPATSGQGLFTIVNPVNHLLFAAWYTYSGGSPRWYVLQLGPDAYTPGSSPTNNVPIYAGTKGLFNSASPTVITDLVGWADMTFIDCGHARINYRFTRDANAGVYGGVDLVKLGPIPAECGLSP